MADQECRPATPRDRAKALCPLLAENAARCEQEGRIVEPVLSALKASGLFRLTAAARAGGAGGRMRDYVEVVAELGKACVGTAWAFGILAAATGTARSLPATQTRSLFRRGDELVCFVGARTGAATPREGGFVVSGAWRYASGCLHADWAMCAVRIESPDGIGQGWGTAFIDLADDAHVEIIRDWQVAGLTGSGSNQISVRGHFVPAHLMLGPVSGFEDALGHDAPEPRDAWPVEPQAPLTVLPALLGAADGLLEAVRAAMSSRPVLGWRYDRQADSRSLLATLGDAAMKIESARMHVLRACDAMDVVAPVRPITRMEKVMAQADCGYAMRLVREAANALMDIAGPSGFAQQNAMQRLWRDINVGTRHNSLNAGFSLELLGAALTGQPSNYDIIPDTGQ